MKNSTLIGEDDKFIKKVLLYYLIFYFLISIYILVHSNNITKFSNISCFYELERFVKDKSQLDATPWESFFYQFKYFTCSNIKLNIISIPLIFLIILYGCVYHSNHNYNCVFEIKALIYCIGTVFVLYLYLYSGLFDFVNSRGAPFSKNPPRYSNLVFHSLVNFVSLVLVLLLLIAAARYIKLILKLNPPSETSND